MERGLDQFIFFAFIVLAALVDWVVRVIRNRNAPPRPPVEYAEAVHFDDDAGYFEQQLDAVPVPAPPPRAVVFDAPMPVEWQRAVESRAQRTAPSRSSGVTGHRWRREALGLREPGAARRAIVMMAVLGPCRALEDRPRP